MSASIEHVKGWVLYLLECANGAYYAGITNDLAARLEAHASGRGAKYTRANPPRHLVGSRPYPDRASASKAEWHIKQLPRLAKLAFITALPGESS
jgi:putative endonuclease